MIRDLVFDMGGVLMVYDPATFTARFDLPEEDRRALEQYVFRSAEWSLLDWGFADEEEVVRSACERLPERLYPYARELVRSWNDPVIPVEGMEELLRQAKKAGYGLYLLSNAAQSHREYWLRVPGHELFDGMVVSSFEKLSKPESAIYELLLERYHLDPAQCVFIDDFPLNVAAGRLCGMNGIVFRGADDLRRELRRLGVELT